MEKIDISLNDIELDDSPDRLFPLVCEQLGYSPEALSEQIHSKIRAIIQKGLTVAAPDFIVRVTPITGWSTGRITGRGVEIDSEHWTALLNKMASPELLCCFMITLGKKLDAIVEALGDTNLFDRFVLDAVGAVMVEQAAHRLESAIGMELEKNGYECSRRFSPGYCDWGLKSGQQSLCRFLDPKKIGIECLATGTMIPTKSVSAVMVGARQVGWKAPCRFCRETNCPYRREIKPPTASNTRPAPSPLTMPCRS